MLYREAHTLLEEIAEATLEGTRKEVVDWLATVPLLIIDDLLMKAAYVSCCPALIQRAISRIRSG